MARMRAGTVLLEVSHDELKVLRKALKCMRAYADYDSQAEMDTLAQLRSDLGDPEESSNG